MSKSTNAAARERLEALVGEWTLEAAPPGGPPWPGGERVTFEFLEGTPLLIERWQVDLPEAPDGTAVIGCDVWKLRRDGEPFCQRFTGEFSEDGKTITGRWEIADDGTTWKTDFDLTYRKVA